MPPHILHEMIKNGEEHHRNWALNTLAQTMRLHGHREILNRYDMTGTDHGLFRVIQSANNKQIMAGQLVRSEGQSLTGDPAIDDAYAFMGDTYNFYFQTFKRNSFDNKGGKLFATVHFGNNFDNAFWNGERLVFGDGDGQIFQQFAKCVEVIGHEFTHGVTGHSANLSYQGQTGAINEGMSDVFGSMVKQFTLNQTAAEANWIIGDGLFEPSINGVGIRSLKAPGTAYNDPLLGKDPCPANMKEFVRTQQDNGGIHINCTIPGHAFYVSAVDLGGHSWQRLGRVWYNVLTNTLHSNAKFRDLVQLTMRTARKLFGNGSNEMKAVRKGWKEVGLI